MNVKSSIYGALPASLQSLALSAYGLALRRQRYGNEYKRALTEISRLESMNPEASAAWRSRALAEMAASAVQGTQFYRGNDGLRRYLSEGNGCIAFTDAVSVLSKDEVRASPDSFYSNAVNESKCIYVNTSGTTGTPINVRVSKSAMQWNYAFFTRVLEVAGLSPFARSVTFAGRLVVQTESSQPPFYRFNRAMNTALFSSYHISEKNMVAYIRELEKINPTYIDTYPSALGSIARYINNEGVSHKVRPKAVITSSETLDQDTRSAIESAFGCTVYDHYGCAEMSGLIYQCEQLKYHADPIFGLVEVLSDTGTPCPSGVEGNLVLTGLVNEAMPLLRYEIGDRAILSANPCDCGRPGEIFEKISGRKDDIIRTPSGKLIGRMDPLFKELGCIVEAQIIQRDLTSVEVVVVATDDFDARVETQLMNAVSARLGGEMQISIRKSSSIPRTRNGKFRAVISLLNE